MHVCTRLLLFLAALPALILKTGLLAGGDVAMSFSDVLRCVITQREDHLSANKGRSVLLESSSLRE